MVKQQSACAKTKTQISFAETLKLISAFVFATRIVQFLIFLKPKFQASSLLRMYSLLCVRPGRKPKLVVVSYIGSSGVYPLPYHKVSAVVTNRLLPLFSSGLFCFWMLVRFHILNNFIHCTRADRKPSCQLAYLIILSLKGTRTNLLRHFKLAGFLSYITAHHMSSFILYFTMKRNVYQNLIILIFSLI